MENLTRDDLKKALCAITTMLGRSKEAQIKFAQGTSQYTLQKNRINALNVASSLLERELAENSGTGSLSKNELLDAVKPIASLISKSEKAIKKLAQGSWQHTMLGDNLNALYIVSPLLARALEEALAKPPQSFGGNCPIGVTIAPLQPDNADEAAQVLRDALGYSKKDSLKEIRHMLKSPRIALMAIADNHVAGIIGAIPQYGVTGWELHPLAVLKEYQRRGIGSALIAALESEAAFCGAITLYLGCDDESAATSLYGADLYNDLFSKIENIQNVGGHPFTFYEKCGYRIVGVFPDVNGIGKPDIWMAKRIAKI